MNAAWWFLAGWTSGCVFIFAGIWFGYRMGAKDRTDAQDTEAFLIDVERALRAEGSTAA